MSVKSDSRLNISRAPDAPPIDQDALTRIAARSLRDEKMGCLVWQGAKQRAGYGAVTYKKRVHSVHRLTYIAHFGPIPKGFFVCHTCDNPPCSAIEHLFLGTPQQNMDDMRRKGRARWRTTVLNPQRAGEIKRRLALGQTVGHIAKDMGLQYARVFEVKSGRSWRDVPAATEPLEQP